jgi:NADH:ubiquinone oxidoreductase subunit H
LGEYLHLFFFSSVISILMLGGWELPNFLLLTWEPLYHDDFWFDMVLSTYSERFPFFNF